MAPPRDWEVLLVGGASGVGKSHLSRRLAAHYNVGLTEVDDIQIVLEQMTTEEQYPAVHFWRLHADEALTWSDAAHLEQFHRICEVHASALAPVIRSHVECESPTIIEGDFISPSLAAGFTGARHVPASVRSLFVFEDTEQRIAKNFRHREDEDQPERARISWLVSVSLRAEVERLGLSSVLASPHATVLDRAIAALEG